MHGVKGCKRSKAAAFQFQTARTGQERNENNGITVEIPERPSNNYEDDKQSVVSGPDASVERES